MGVHALAVAPSNPAAENLASAVERRAPEMGTIPFHSYHSEIRALCRQADQLSGQDPADTDDTKAIEVVENVAPPTLGDATGQARHIKAWNEVLSDAIGKVSKWRSAKSQRLNHKTMGLSFRALQNDGTIDHQITHLTSSESNPHKAYREMFESPAAFGTDATDDDIAEYKALEDELMQDTMQKIPRIITTCSNAADTTLTKAKKPRVVIVDEARSAQNFGTLITWAHNSSTMVLIIFVADPIQLPTAVKTRHMNTADKSVNPFAPRLCMCFFERLWHRGATVLTFPNSFERQLVLNNSITSCIRETGYPTARVPQLQIGSKRKKQSSLSRRSTVSTTEFLTSVYMFLLVST